MIDKKEKKFNILNETYNNGLATVLVISVSYWKNRNIKVTKTQYKVQKKYCEVKELISNFLSIKKLINKSKLYEVPSRLNAIKEAIKNLNSGEILVVAGKGHENIQDFGNVKNFFSDKEIILKYIKIKNKNLSRSLKINILSETSGQNSFLLKTKIKNAKDLEKIVKDVLESNQKTILLAIYNNQNQRRYIGVKLD